MAASALVRPRGEGGTVTVIAESVIPTVQALVRWDPVAHAVAELDSRAEVALPPAVHIAAIDGAPQAVTAMLETAELPDSADLLGPVDLPAGARRPPGTPADSPVSRMLVRVPRDGGLALAAALRRATVVLSARHDQSPVRVQIDPLHIG
jgi:primosomal protein N' (replication factor Y) (superfamily II helicase)